jgi:putative phosphoesterase
VTRLAIISDTHLPRGARRLPDTCLARLRDAELILHAGDLAALSVLEELEAIGPPVLAVHGNVDTPEVVERVPAERVEDVGGVRIAMVHDAGPATGRMGRMRRRFPDAAVVVFGHSHIPLHETGDDGLVLFNPGSPTDRRRQPHHTMGTGEARDGRIALELITLD